MKHNSIEKVQSLTNDCTETIGNIVKYKGRPETQKWLRYDLKCSQESLFLSISFVQAATSYTEQICTSTSCQQATRTCSQPILRRWGFRGASLAGTELSATPISCSASHALKPCVCSRGLLFSPVHPQSQDFWHCLWSICRILPDSCPHLPTPQISVSEVSDPT